MKEYILCTTTEKYRKLYSSNTFKQKIVFIFAVIITAIFAPLFAFDMLIDKQASKEIKYIFKSIKITHKLIFIDSRNATYGSYFSKSKNIFIDLESHNLGKESKTIKEITKTIIHEDLHKAMDNIGIGFQNHHFAIEKLGY